MRLSVIIAGLSGATAVGIAAYATHGDALTESAREMVHTAAHYQLVHALALLAAERLGARLAALLFTAGLILFPGTLYLLAFGVPHAPSLAAPFGGTAFILGWLALAWSGARRSR